MLECRPGDGWKSIRGKFVLERGVVVYYSDGCIGADAAKFLPWQVWSVIAEDVVPTPGGEASTVRAFLGDVYEGLFGLAIKTHRKDVPLCRITFSGLVID